MPTLRELLDKGLTAFNETLESVPHARTKKKQVNASEVDRHVWKYPSGMSVGVNEINERIAVLQPTGSKTEVVQYIHTVNASGEQMRAEYDRGYKDGYKAGSETVHAQFKQPFKKSHALPSGRDVDLDDESEADQEMEEQENGAGAPGIELQDFEIQDLDAMVDEYLNTKVAREHSNARGYRNREATRKFVEEFQHLLAKREERWSRQSGT